MVNTYRKGRIAEKKVMNWLREHGFYNLRRSKRSRGPYDIYARSPSGVKTYVQVKSGSARITKKEIEKLREIARKRKGFAAYVHKDKGNKVRMVPLGNWAHKDTPTKLRKKRNANRRKLKH
jgi:Holliday junction resolvase